VKVAEAVESWGLDYIVLTMVDRDDLPDQGAAHVVSTVQELKRRDPRLRVETLVGDFQGRKELVEQVVASGMDVFAHNIETVARLTKTVRDRRAGYEQTLAVLKHAKEARPDVVTKSSIMLGLGERAEEIHQVMHDLKAAGVEILTFGQYLQPTKRHMKVDRYVTPEEFEEWKVAGEALGFHVASGPLVRSSYRAGDFFKERLARRATAAAVAPRPDHRQVDGERLRPRELGFDDLSYLGVPHVGGAHSQAART
jgi:lipoic acid synthetase